MCRGRPPLTASVAKTRLLPALNVCGGVRVVLGVGGDRWHDPPVRDGPQNDLVAAEPDQVPVIEVGP
jgi:hypothetical protein